MRLMAAQTLRLWTIGRTYGQATTAAVKEPDSMTVVKIHFIQLIGRLMAGCGRPGRWRLSQAWTCSALCGLWILSAGTLGPIVVFPLTHSQSHIGSGRARRRRGGRWWEGRGTGLGLFADQARRSVSTGMIDHPGGSSTYAHEDIFSNVEVETRKNEARLALLVALDPALRQQVPFGLELSAELTRVPRIQRRQHNSGSVVAGRRCQRPVARIVELDGGPRERLGVEFGESLLGRLLLGKSPRCAERRNESRQPAHLDFRYGEVNWEKERRSKCALRRPIALCGRLLVVVFVVVAGRSELGDQLTASPDLQICPQLLQ